MVTRGKPKGKSKLLISRSLHYLGNHSILRGFSLSLSIHFPLLAARIVAPNYIVIPLPVALISS